jgi:arylsulfatase A-like enzyme
MRASQNIILIILDACRARNLSCYGYNFPTSPNIDRIADEGILFENAFSTSNVTDVSLSSIFSGLYPISHGVTIQAQMENLINPGVKLLPEILKSEGYRTMAIDWLSRYHKRGYDWYGYLPERPSFGEVKTQALNIRNILKFWLPYNKIPYNIRGFLKRIYNKILPDWYPRWYDARKTTNTALKLLEKEKNSNRNFFMFIHYWDTHTPYNAPASYADRFYRNEEIKFKIDDIIESCLKEDVKRFYFEWMKTVRNVEEVLSKYDGAISYIDEQIGRIYDYLDENGILDETVLLITSDHGECLLEHGIFFDHHGGLYDEILHVPLIIRCPNLFPKGKRIKNLVQHTDITPTILEMLDIEWTRKDEGISLFPAIIENEKIRDYIYAVMDNEERYAIRSSNYKYIMRNKLRLPNKKYKNQQGINEDEELYDLNSDPGEQFNLAKECLETAIKLNYLLNLHLENQRKKVRSLKVNGKKGRIDNSEKRKLEERLRALGYLN